MIDLISHSEIETIEYGKQIASQLKKGDIILLCGELGSGKTKLTEGILSYFHLQNEISSPTFTIVNEYQSPSFPLYHFDVYRLEDSDEFYAIGGEEYFEKGACIIEWGEKVESILPPDYTKISFFRNFEKEDNRILEIENFGNSKITIS